MYIVLGATGHVGSVVADKLLTNDEKVKVLLHNEKKAADWEKKGAETATVDVGDVKSLQQAFEGGERLFLMIPPADFGGDALNEERKILANYKKTLNETSIKKIAGLSSYGAQFSSDTGSLLVSHEMEHIFEGLPFKKSFVRPAYYFTNWDMSLESAQKEGVVHTYFPIDMTLPMVSPQDIGELVARVLQEPINTENTYHIEAGQHYSSIDVARAFSKSLEKEVTAFEIKPSDWKEAMQSVGFSSESADQFIAMTKSVIEKEITPDSLENLQKGKVTLEEHIKNLVAKH